MPDKSSPLMRKGASLAGALLAGSLLLSACGSDSSSDDTSNESTETTETTETTEPTTEETTDESPSEEPGSGAEASQSGRLNATEAVARALEEVPGGAVVEMEQGREGLSRVWDIDVLGSDGAGTNLYLNLKDGTVVKRESTRLDSVHQTAPTVTAQGAIDAAVGAVPGSVLALDLDRDAGRVVWEVIVRADDKRRWEIYVDAETGEIVKQERD